MIPGIHPVYQALLGTLFTWGLTASGSALVYVLDVENKKQSQKILDTMLGFAAGVMIAASYWSLLAPAIEIAEKSPLYGPDGRWAFIPAAVGFGMGAISMIAAENFIPFLESWLRPQELSKKNDDIVEDNSENGVDPMAKYGISTGSTRVLLLVVAITVHNFPEGMAVGVGFGSIGQSSTATFSNAVNLAIGIGLQNFPEGLAVSMPLRREGMSLFQAFWWGQLSGIVEPIGGLLGAGAVMYVEPILPYALAFAAGAMIFVVVDDLIPEAHQSGNQKLSTLGTIAGFIVMMTMDVALG